MKLCNTQNELTTEYILPVKIIASVNAENVHILLEEHPAQPFLGKAEVSVIKKNGYILFDFGEEFQGGADVVLQGDEKKRPHLRAVFGESVSEALSKIGEKNSGNDHSPRDIILEAPFLSHLYFGNTGFRFLKLEAVDEDLEITSLRGISRFRKLEYKGSFKCSDERLNKIWQVGAKTVHLNMQEYLWDGIKRDRLVWIGDMHPETSTISMVFGDTSVVRNSLDFIKDNTDTDSWMNGIPSYSMWWIKIHRDLYWENGDKEYLRNQLDYIVSVLKKTISSFKGDTSDIKSHFTEWSSANTKDEDAGFYAMLILGLEAGAEIIDILNGDKALAAQARELSNVIKSKKVLIPENKQIAAMLGLSGICDLNNMCEIIKSDGAKGLSTFWGYYVLNALWKNGDMNFALKLINTYWGTMLDFGATTFWEDFDIEWAKNAAPIDQICPPGKDDIHGDFGKFCYTQFRHSLCHGWASGPTAFLSKKVLGIVPVEPGYKKITVSPCLDNLEFAEGTVPTPYGIIKVKHTNIGGKIKTELSLPNGVEKI